MAESSSTAAESFSSTYAESEGICYEHEACNGDFGLDDKVKDFENTVMLPRQQSGKPRFIGIVGLCGIGKTTLAKLLFDRKRSHYSRTCFLADVRENERNDGLISLQKKLLRNAIEPLLQHSLNGHVIIPVRGNDIDDDDSGIVATPDSNPVQGNDDIDDDDSGIVANPVQGNDRGYVQNISSLFATCHGAILAVVALIMSAPVSSAVRIFILFISALVSVAIIRDLVVKSYKEFSVKRGEQSLRNFLVANQWWVTQRIVLFLIFIMLSLCLLLASNRMLRLHHH